MPIQCGGLERSVGWKGRSAVHLEQCGSPGNAQDSQTRVERASLGVGANVTLTTLIAFAGPQTRRGDAVHVTRVALT